MRLLAGSSPGMLAIEFEQMRWDGLAEFGAVRAMDWAQVEERRPREDLS